MLKTVDYSYNSSGSITTNVENYLTFARTTLSSRAVELNVFEVAALYPTVTAGNLVRINFTVYNLIGGEIDFVNLTFSATNVSVNATKLRDTTSSTSNSTFTTSAAINYTLTIFWNTTTGNNTETVIIPVDVGKSRLIGFYDIQLKSSKLNQRDKIVKTIDLPS